MSSSKSVLVILSNYKRPSNIPRCISAWKCQSIPPDCLVVVDNSPKPLDEDLPERYPNPLFEGATDVWRWTSNLGCPARFAPALALYQYDYVIFADDDLIPGKYGVEIALNTAGDLRGDFATIGQYGRIIDTSRPEGKRYVNGNCPRSDTVALSCDITCRCYMVLGKYVQHMLPFRRYLYDQIMHEEDKHLLDIHDDILMCAGIQWATGKSSYVIPKVGNPEYQLIAQNLDEGSSDISVWRRPNHFKERNRMVDICIQAGWMPVV